MNIDEYGLIKFSEKEIFEKIYTSEHIDLSKIFIDNQDVINKFNQSISLNFDNLELLKESPKQTKSVTEVDIENQKIWFMPDDYFPNLIEHLYSLCKTKEEETRVSEELELFIKKDMLALLFYLKYLVDTMRKHNIVWGVGRGSSVASFVLYLIGVHKINSLKYNLDIHEFLK